MTKRENFEKLNDLLDSMQELSKERYVDFEFMGEAYFNTCNTIAKLINESKEDYKWKIVDFCKDYIIVTIYDRFCLEIYFTFGEIEIMVCNPFTKKRGIIDLKITDSLSKALMAINKNIFELNSKESIEKIVNEAMDKYECVDDLQGSLFGVGNVETIEEWRETALEWADLDENDSAFEHLRSLPESDVISFIEEYWDIVIKKVE